jgi:hypothetical protein
MTAVSELELAEVDLGGTDLVGDSYHARLAQLVSQGEYRWLARSPLAYLVLDRDSAEFFLRSRDTAFPGREIADLFGVGPGRLREQIDANILNQQGEQHRRLRALVGPAFTPRAADRWRPAMREFLAGLWDTLSGGTECDFVTAVAKPYPALTIATVLGAPLADAPRLHDWSSLIQRQFDIRALTTQIPELERAADELYAYVEELLSRRRSEPGDDLLTVLLTAEEAGDRLSHAECVNLVLNVIAGGIDTTQAQRTRISGRPFGSGPSWPAGRSRRYSGSSRSRRSPPGSACARSSTAVSSSPRARSSRSARNGATASRTAERTLTSRRPATSGCSLSARARTSAWARTWPGQSCRRRWPSSRRGCRA